MKDDTVVSSRSSTLHRHRVGVCLGLIAVVATGALSACGGQSESGLSRAVDAYAAALSAGDVSRAANLTTAPAQAGLTLDASLRGIDAKSVAVVPSNQVEYSDGSGSFTLKSTYDLGVAPRAAATAPHRLLVLTSTGTARDLTTGWRLQWDPALLYQGLPVGGSLRVVRADAAPAPQVLGVSGSPWMEVRRVHNVVITPSKVPDPAATARKLAAVIGSVAPDINAARIEALANSQSGPTTVVSLRDSDFNALTDDPSDVPGVTVATDDALLPVNESLDSPLTDSMVQQWTRIRDAASGWEAQVIHPGAAPTRIDGQPGTQVPNLNAAFDATVQLAVRNSVVEVAQPAQMMVLDARSGAIEAAAGNDAADAAGLSLSDRYLVGRTLDPVRSAIDRAAGGDAVKSKTMAANMGLGLGYGVPGVTVDNPANASKTSSGSPGTGILPAAFNLAEPRASMLEMGTLGVALARGNAVAPWILRGVTTLVSGGSLGTVDPTVLATTRAAMATTAATGDASDITRAPGLSALVGTNGPQGPGWFVGQQGGRILVIYSEGAKSGTAALAVAQRYFSQS